MTLEQKPKRKKKWLTALKGVGAVVLGVTAESGLLGVKVSNLLAAILGVL